MGSNREILLNFHSAGDVTVKPGQHLEVRRLADYELVYFPKSSETVYTLGEIPHALGQPCVLLTRPGEPHAYRFDTQLPTRHLFLHFDFAGGLFERRYPSLAVGTPVVRLQEQSLVPVLMKQMLYLFHTRGVRWHSFAETLVLTVLEEMEAQLSTGGGPGGEPALKMPAQIAAALEYIERHADGPIDVEALAQLSGWSHEHFTRTFQRYVGHSPKAWISQRRIDLAAQHLLQSPDSVKQIARGLGFADEYYFHRLFRRLMGMTAVEYRRKFADSRMRQLAPPGEWERFYPLNHFVALRDLPAD
ncbi:AraC family transcriptional regulator [Paenibacillus koleovorans]|uniref:AraC family transcriptional regulator n=1 Tax=Paenibacillus koleovorans TaxID=121608 RepID=UPI000FD6C94E|nr:AraC family transcriptional regulator [Paenibacillus koleovorans]